MASIEGEIVKSKTIEGEVNLVIGLTPDIQIGETTTLESGAEATVELAQGSTRTKPIFNFGIPAGKNYEITDSDYAAIGNKVLDNINPTLESNLQEAKSYADSIKPTKTSELTNDSNFAVTDQNNNFSTSQTVNGTLTVNGNIVQNGETYETHAEKVFTTNDEIITRDGAVGGLSEGTYTGIVAKNYDGENDGRLGFNAAGEACVGDVGDEQPLLTRDKLTNLQEGQVLIWDGTNLKAVGSSVYVKNTDYATTRTTGVVKVEGTFGVLTDSTGRLYINPATTSEIDEKTNKRKPIVPENLDYAVKSVVGGHVTLTQDDYNTLVSEGTVTTEAGITYTFDENTYYYIKEEE